MQLLHPFDLKLFDEQLSRRYTGQSNKLILENFKRLLKVKELKLIPRIPLIPEITTNKKNLAALANYLRELGVKQVALLPYNPLWTDKIKKFGLDVSYQRDTFMSAEEIQNSLNYFQSSL